MTAAEMCCTVHLAQLLAIAINGNLNLKKSLSLPGSGYK